MLFKPLGAKETIKKVQLTFVISNVPAGAPFTHMV